MRSVQRLVMVAVLAGLAVGPSATRAAQAAPVRPNIVFILVDDMRTSELVDMPNVRRLIGDAGVTYGNAYVINPLCCPSRATILTGKTSGGTDIWDNTPPDGGFNTFRKLKEEASDLPVWLHDAGYTTGLVGKYLNGYTPAQATYLPPGWDAWHALALGVNGGDGEGKGGYYNYSTSDGGVLTAHGATEADYSTTVLSHDATDFIRSAPAGRPLFLYFAPRAPHGPATPEQKYATAPCPTSTAPRVPSFFEADVSDKPGYIQAQPTTGRARVDKSAAARCRTLLSVDDAVAAIGQALTDTGRLQNTLLVFMSDNGYLLGEHRWVGKTVPYEESTSVPLLMRWDGVLPAGTTDGRLATNEDLAVTFANAAGAASPGAGGEDLTGPPQRQDFLLEHQGGGAGVPAYCGVHTGHLVYILYDTGEQELYDLSQDPYEVSNMAADPGQAATVATLRARALALCTPRPPGWTQG